MKPVFDREEIDFQRDLEILHEAIHYREWLFHRIRPHLGARIFEIGSGIGNYTEKLLSSEIVVATDYEKKYVDTLRSRFDKHPQVKALLLDIMSVAPEQRTELVSMKLDTAVALNVLEHIKDDEKCLKTISEIVRPGGQIILICPAHKVLYNALDRSYGHYRRYDKITIRRLASAVQAKIVKLAYFNPFGILGWFLNGTCLKRTTLPPLQTKAFDAIIPMLEKVDRLVSWPAGLSLFAVLKKDYPEAT